jgi:hypothetical protein
VPIGVEVVAVLTPSRARPDAGDCALHGPRGNGVRNHLITAARTRVGTVAGMKRLWFYRYGALSICLSCADFLIVFGGTGAWSSAPPPAPHSEPYQRLASLGLGLATGSLGVAGLGLARERPKKLALAAITVSWLALFLCGMRLAV